MVYRSATPEFQLTVLSNQTAIPAGDTGIHITQDALRSLISIQERELSRIARELHDDICQRLAMLSLRIEKVAKAWSTGQAQIGEQLEQIRQNCSALTGDVQALSHELHPSILDNLGLVTALKSLCREVVEQSGVTVEFHSWCVPQSLPREVSLSLFRLVQEALHNSVKYSRSDFFQVHLQGIAGGIQLDVSDRGVGFDVARVEQGQHLGLVSMRERIQLLNGTIHIDSKRNCGTRIHAQVPLFNQREIAMATYGGVKDGAHQDPTSRRPHLVL